jgi:Peptidase family S41
MTPEASTAAALVCELCVWLDRLFPDADRGERLKRALEECFGADARPVTNELCREVEGVARDFSRHFELEYIGDGSLVPDTESPGWPPQDPREVQLRAGSVGQVTRQAGGVGVISVLVSGHTFSSGEGLAYQLQSQGRTRLVGQRTPGAADHITPVRVTPHVRRHRAIVGALDARRHPPRRLMWLSEKFRVVPPRLNSCLDRVDCREG